MQYRLHFINSRGEERTVEVSDDPLDITAALVDMLRRWPTARVHRVEEL